MRKNLIGMVSPCTCTPGVEVTRSGYVIDGKRRIRKASTNG
ncbi:MAG: hypothetical protein A4E42_00286 [Methanoregulaceae archaeon PtaU1.Bin222]|nr:MAG: hypothetical protein A4E42_00286 [Methanoregulaceae archaeon PtaU1.Bin222]